MVPLRLVYTFVAYRLRVLATEVTRVTLEVGSQGKLGGQAHVPYAEGIWLDLVRNVTFLLLSGAAATQLATPAGQSDVLFFDRPSTIHRTCDNSHHTR